MYELAGIPRAKILQIATIDAARIMKDDREYGSLTVGKVADLLVVNGDPTRQISELTKLETVVRGGRLYPIEALRKAGVGGAQGMGAADGDGLHWH
jgi:imidazolonepropionase-like amidohydrolase